MEPIAQNMARTGAYLISEPAGYRGRDQASMASGAGKVQPGTVCGKVTATGKFKPLNPTANDGTEVAAAVLFQGCDATDADVRRTFTVRDTEVTEAELIWPAGITANQKSNAITELSGRGIIVR
jgi:hypothetical protein